MDDFNTITLTESRNEYCMLLLSKITPLIHQGFNTMLNEAYDLCNKNSEPNKYLMTFQNILSSIKKWSQETIDTETERIKNNCNCSYIEDLITCVYITQLKILTSIRVGSKQRKLDIDIPDINTFVHNIYIEASRKLYRNVFLFDINVSSLQKQKNMREIQLLIKESILETIRNNMPLETILKSYLYETTEKEVEEIKEEIKEVIEPIKENNEYLLNNEISQNNIQNLDSSNNENITLDISNNNNIMKNENINKNNIDLSNDNVSNDINSISQNNELNSNIKQEHNERIIDVDTNNIEHTNNVNNLDENNNSIINNSIENSTENSNEKIINFNDTDGIVNFNSNEETTKANKEIEEKLQAPKDIQTLEEISEMKWNERNEEDTESDDEDERIKILDEKPSIDVLGIETLDNKPNIGINNNKNENLLGEIEVLN